MSVLREIRILVDDFDRDERNTKKWAIVTSVIVILFILWLVYYYINYESKYRQIITSNAPLEQVSTVNLYHDSSKYELYGKL